MIRHLNRRHERMITPLPSIGQVDLTRREFTRRAASFCIALGSGALSGRAFGISAGAKSTDIRVEQITTRYENYRYRAPVKFAGQIMDQATVLTVQCTVSTRNGNIGHGFGSMPFNHIFSYPSKTMSHDAKDGAMKALA